MRLHQRITLALLVSFFACGTPAAQTNDTTGFFVDGHAGIDLRHRIATPEGTTELLGKALVGDFAISVSTYCYKTQTWGFGFSFKTQSLYGGFNNRRAKIYAVNYFITAHGEYFFPDGWYVSLETIHQSTHVADKIEVENETEYLDLQVIRFDLEDINVPRLTLGQNMPNYAWAFGFQPVKLNYFLFAEFDRMFNHESYEAYARKFYVNGSLTLWRTSSDRISVSLEGEFDGGSQYIAKISYATRLSGRMAALDGIQFFVGREGGIGQNVIKATSYSGISTDRWLIGAHIAFQ